MSAVVKADLNAVVNLILKKKWSKLNKFQRSQRNHCFNPWKKKKKKKKKSSHQNQVLWLSKVCWSIQFAWGKDDKLIRFISLVNHRWNNFHPLHIKIIIHDASSQIHQLRAVLDHGQVDQFNVEIDDKADRHQFFSFFFFYSKGSKLLILKPET